MTDTQRRRTAPDLVSTGLAALFLTAVVTLLSGIVAAVANVFKWYELLAGIGIVGASFTALAIFVVHQIARPLRESFLVALERFQASSVIANSDWLISSPSLRDMERATNASHVWIITRSLEEEVESELFGEVVEFNLKRGIKYTYILPNEASLYARIEKMRDMYNYSNLEFRIIESPLFDIISSQDMAIFGPDGRGSREMAGYMNLPIDTGGNDYFVVLGTRQSERIVGILSRTPSTIV
jgi:hypothetical protein